MTERLPLPRGTSDFRFLRSDSAPGYVVLEFDTTANPIRVFLSRDQLEQLIAQARLTSKKLRQNLL